MSASSRGSRAAVPLLRRAPQTCTQCAHRQPAQPASRRAYSASPTSLPVEPGITTTPPPTSAAPATAEPQTTHPRQVYSLRAGVILSRPPLLTRDQTPFEQAFYLYQKRLNERLSTPFARRFFFKPDQPSTIDFSIKWAERGHTMERGIGRVTRSGKWAWDDELLAGGQGEAIADPAALREALYTDAESRVSEDGERLSFEDRMRVERPFPRRTEADRTGDVRRLDRALDRTLYLVVRKDDGLWRFPQDDVRTDEALHETAARALASAAGVNMNTWMVGRAPVAHEHREPIYTGGREGDAEPERRLKKRGRDVFYLRARIMAGQVDLASGGEAGVTDFKWLTKEELAGTISQQTLHSVRNSMPAR